MCIYKYTYIYTRVKYILRFPTWNLTYIRYILRILMCDLALYIYILISIHGRPYILRIPAWNLAYIRRILRISTYGNWSVCGSKRLSHSYLLVRIARASLPSTGRFGIPIGWAHSFCWRRSRFVSDTVRWTVYVSVLAT